MARQPICCRCYSLRFGLWEQVSRVVLVLATITGGILFLAVAGWTVYHGETRYSFARDRDASGFLAQVGFDSLPAESVIFTDWNRSRPLWYARTVLSDRTDVRIVTGSGAIEPSLWPTVANRPVFCTKPAGAPKGWRFVWHGDLWKLMHED